MTKHTETRVLVVGGGASGTMLSLQLSRYGVDFRTVDRLPGPAPTSRAITVHSRMLEIFECIDVDLADRFKRRGIVNQGYDLHYVNEGKRDVVRMGIDFTITDCKYPFLLIHRQDETEKFLREYWREKFNREAEWGTRLIDLAQDEDGVTATVTHGNDDNNRETIRARYVIACDGINSQARRCLSIEQDESGYQGTILQNLDIRLNDFPDATDHIHYCAGTDHFMMVAYLPGDFFRLLVSDRGETADDAKSPEENIQRLMDQHFDGVSMGERIWHSKWESWVRLAKTYRENNVFLVGDSAHVHSTTGGQGMNCCIQDAWNLGWKLGMVEQGLANPSLLDTYEAERHPIAEQVIWAASSLHDIFMGHGKDIGQRGEQMQDDAYMHKVVGCCSGISYTYRDYVRQYPSQAAFPGPRIGDRAPDAPLANGGNLFSVISDTRYTLLLPDTAGDDAAALASLLAPYQASVKLHATGHAPVFDSLYQNADTPLLYLVRPDAYIGFRCPVADTASLQAFLAEQLVWQG